MESQRSERFHKDHTLQVKFDDLNISMEEVIDAIVEVIGDVNMAVVPNLIKKVVEISVETEEHARILTEEGIVIKGVSYDIESRYSPHTVVSIFNLPAHLEDQKVLDKLISLGVKPVGTVVRHFYKKYPKVEDGTRHVKCEFPPSIKSLPWAMNFITPEGPQSCKVLHNNQTRVCFKCLSPDHLKKECPLIKCRICKKSGHMAFLCKEKICDKCDRISTECNCELYFETSESLDMNLHIITENTFNNKRDLSNDDNHEANKKQKQTEIIKSDLPSAESTRNDDQWEKTNNETPSKHFNDYSIIDEFIEETNQEITEKEEPLGPRTRTQTSRKTPTPKKLKSFKSRESSPSKSIDNPLPRRRVKQR